MRETAGEGQALGISVLPTMEEAETITLAQVSEAYEKMIREDRIDIFVEGQVDPATVISLLKHAFPSKTVSWKSKANIWRKRKRLKKNLKPVQSIRRRLS